MHSKLTTSFALLFVLATAAGADPIYQSGVGANIQAPVNAFVSDGNNNLTGNWAAVPFTLTAGSQITSLTVQGVYINTPVLPPDLFTVGFFQNGGNAPGALISPSLSVSGVVRTATGVAAFGTQVYQFELTLTSAVTLAPGVYWLSVANNTTTNAATATWYWTASANGTFPGAESPVSQVAGYTFSTDLRTQVFSLDGTIVPEPSSVALVLVGALALAALHRRHRRLV